MKKLLIALGVFLVIIIMFKEGDKQETNNKKYNNTQTINKPSHSSKEQKLKSLMVYLDDISEVKWWEVDENTIYINFNPTPNDWKAIIRGAALGGNEKIGFGVHVWALNNKNRGWRPGDSGYLGNVTARYGKIKWVMMGENIGTIQCPNCDRYDFMAVYRKNNIIEYRLVDTDSTKMKSGSKSPEQYQKSIFKQAIWLLHVSVFILQDHNTQDAIKVDNMNKHEKINYVEFPSKNLEKTKIFFTKAFGWSFIDYGPEYTAFSDKD